MQTENKKVKLIIEEKIQLEAEKIQQKTNKLKLLKKNYQKKITNKKETLKCFYHMIKNKKMTSISSKVKILTYHKEEKIMNKQTVLDILDNHVNFT